MAYPIASHRIQEVVQASKCLRDGEALEPTSKGSNSTGFDVTLDLIDDYADLRYLGKAHDLTKVDGYEANLLLAPIGCGALGTTPSGHDTGIRIASRLAGTRIFWIRTFPRGTPISIATRHCLKANPTLLPGVIYDPAVQEIDSTATAIGESVCELFCPYYETARIHALWIGRRRLAECSRPFHFQPSKRPYAVHSRGILL